MNFRLYSFVNFYLSPIQQGIQTAHLIHELYAATFSKRQRNVLRDWTWNDKTIIVLNGGNLDVIHDKYALISEFGNLCKLPYTCFHEDDSSLGGIMTCCGVIVPEKMWAAVNHSSATQKGITLDDIDNGEYYYEDINGGVTVYLPDTLSHDMITMIKSCRLAQ